MSRRELKDRILSYPRWYHSIRLDEQTKITGWAEQEQAYPPTAFAEMQFQYYQLPEDWTNKTVLDIGGWDGAISFEMERRGSSEVVLINPYSLSDLDFPIQGEWSLDYFQQLFREKGYPLEEVHSGSARLLIDWFNSKVQILHLNVYDLSRKIQKQFDLVLCLGLLYHLRDPLRGLEEIAKVTKDQLILETMCLPEDDPLAHVKQSWCEFLGGDQGQNWWRFNFHSVEKMLRASGFQRIERKTIWRSRCVYHAYKI
jgi:tRNA (mo5U34)-methyltransferase